MEVSLEDISMDGAGDAACLHPSPNTEDVDGGPSCNENVGEMASLGEDCVQVPAVGMTFRTWEEVEAMYKLYGKANGFGVARTQASFNTNHERRGMTWKCECWGIPNRKQKKQMKKREEEMANGGNMYDGKVMSRTKLRQFILHPDDHESRVEKFMMVDDEGVCNPGHIPPLEDLFGYSDVFVTLVRNQIETLQESNSDLLIPPLFCPVLDPKPNLDMEALVYAIGNLPIRMSFASYTDAFQVNQFFCNLQVASIIVFHSIIEEEHMDGVVTRRRRRYHDVRIDPEYFHRYCRKPIPLRVGSRIVTWNVRGVARPSFYDNFEKICTTYNPIVVILVESRISEKNMNWIMSRFSSKWAHVMFGNFASKGGPVVVIYDKQQVKIMDFLYEDDPWLASIRVQGLPRTEYEKHNFS